MRDRLLLVAGARTRARPHPRGAVVGDARARRACSLGALRDRRAGACPKSPDELAKLARLVRIAWPRDGGPQVFIPVQPFGWHARDLRDADRYPYQGPLQRNEAMALWAGDQLRAGRDVDAVTLRCDWPLKDGERKTLGTTHARDHLVTQLGAARVTDLVCPREFGPGGTP